MIITKKISFLTILIIGVLSVCSNVSAQVSGTFDSSDYRQNTYGAPNRYVDPTRSLSSNGSGTLSDPWNLNQAMSLAVAGDVVGFLPGVSVRMPSTDNDNIPTFRPTNSGTINNRIVYVTRYAAVALPNVATNANRTELRHDGTPGVANGEYEIGTGSAMYGTNGTNYITFDGFFVDMAQAEPTGDGGVIRVENGRGVHFRNFEIKGTVTNMQSNAVIYRPHNATDTVLSNFRAYDFSNDTTNSNVPQGSLFSDQYSDRNFLIEHFEISNTGRGIFLKGGVGNGNNYGTIRYGIVRDLSGCFRFNALDTVNMTTVHNNLCYNYGQVGLDLSNETSPPTQFFAHHNTFANGDGNDINFGGPFYLQEAPSLTNVTLRDNIFDFNGPNGAGTNAWEFSSTFPVMNYNGYYRGGGSLTWAYAGSVYNTLSAWRSVTGQESNSQVLSSSPFINRTNRDFHVTAGHQAKTMSSTGGEIGAYSTSEIIGVVTSGTVPPPPPPPPPPPTTAVPGDINLDHIVNSLDWSIMSGSWLTANTQADLNRDGQVNSLDFSILSSNWLRTW